MDIINSTAKFLFSDDNSGFLYAVYYLFNNYY